MLSPVSLMTEYKTDPVGMDELFPRFFYRLEGDSPLQSARRIAVRDSSGSLVWDSGYVESSECVQIRYEGIPLRPFSIYKWSVSVRGSSGMETQSAEASFETGFLGMPWEGKWIGSAPHSANLRPVPLFRQGIDVDRKIVSARLYISALGMYSAFLDGVPVSDICFAPGWTDYYKRVMYEAFDVTALLTPGRKNVLCVKLAEGWFAGRIARMVNSDNPSYGDQPLFRAELHIRNADGSVRKLLTDESWETRNSEILMSDIYDGERCRAYIKDNGWMTVTDGRPGAHVFDKKIRMEWHSGAFVRRMHELAPVSIKKMRNGAYIVDFGQNLAGRERFTLKGASKGDVITVRHGEMLYPNGLLFTENLRSARAETVYEASDEPEQTYEPEFTFYGFRYLEIFGWPGVLAENMIRAVSIYSDLPETGGFECSDPLVNRLFSNIVWGQRGNFIDIPTDCPQRDERLGWSGDTQVFANVATYNMFAPEFYRKWIRDLNLTASPEGAYQILSPAPCPLWHVPGRKEVTGWSDAGIVCPWQMYRKYGDLSIMEEYMDNMARSLDLQVEQAGGPIVSNAVFGDWLNIDAATDARLLSTAYLIGMNKLLGRMARLVGRSGTAALRERIAAEISASYIAEFFTKTGELKVMTQTAALLTLYFGIAEGVRKEKTLAFLLKDIIETRKLHLSTGFLGTPLLLKVLSDNGHVDTAYALLRQTDYPGWLYPVTQGATTMWERWNSWTHEGGFGDTSMNSFNHYAYGAVGEWFYETVCGIQPLEDDPSAKAFRKFRLAPKPGGGLTYASAVYESMYGRILSAWRLDGKKLEWDFSIPCGSEAEIVFPSCRRIPEVPGIAAADGKYHARAGNYTLKLLL